MTIDGKNIKTEYGCTLLWQSFDALLKFPKRKAVVYNNWAESDGIEPDLTDVEYESKNIQLVFLLESRTLAQFWELYKKLYSDITAPGYRILDFTNLLQYKLRYDISSKYVIPQPFNIGENITSFTLDFIEDKPSIPETNGVLGSGNAPGGMYQINGNDFSVFGIGADSNIDELLKYPKLKDPFTDGDNIFLDNIRTVHKEVSLSLWMVGKSEKEFLNNYKAFFTQLSRPGTQSLFIEQLGISTSMYYSDCTNFKIETWNKNLITARFSISIVIPVVTWVDAGGIKQYSVLRDLGSNCVLADEEGRVIVFK